MTVDQGGWGVYSPSLARWVLAGDGRWEGSLIVAYSQADLSNKRQDLGASDWVAKRTQDNPTVSVYKQFQDTAT